MFTVEVVQVASSAFIDCFIVGLLAQPLFGDSLYLQSSQQLSPFLLAGAVLLLFACEPRQADRLGGPCSTMLSSASTTCMCGVDVLDCACLCTLGHVPCSHTTLAASLRISAPPPRHETVDQICMHAGWAGLVWNGLNLIPMGQLDGGRVAHAVWGRRAATAINVVVTLVLGLAGIIDSLALYWILFVLFLQRGPIPPQQDEVSQPEGNALLYGAALLFIPLLTLFPYPVDVSSGPFGPM